MRSHTARKPGGACARSSRAALSPRVMASAGGPLTSVAKDVDPSGRRMIARRCRSSPCRARRDRRSACGRSRRAPASKRALAGERHARRPRSRIGRSAAATGASSAARRNARSRPARRRARNRAHRAAAVARSARPSRFSPASARIVASISPRASLASRVSTLPRRSVMARSGRSRSSMRAAPQRGRADDAARRQGARVVRLGGNPGVARILARQIAGDLDALRQEGRQILGRMDGEIDVAAHPARCRVPW